MPLYVEESALQAMTQLPLDPVPPSSFMGGREVSSLQTTQLPLEPVPSSLLTGVATMSSTLEVVAVKESIARGWVWMGEERWIKAHRSFLPTIKTERETQRTKGRRSGSWSTSRSRSGGGQSGDLRLGDRYARNLSKAKPKLAPVWIDFEANNDSRSPIILGHETYFLHRGQDIALRFLRGAQLYFGKVAVQADRSALTAFIGSRVQLGMLPLPVLWSLEPNQRAEVPLVYLTGQGHQGRQPKSWLQSEKKPQCNCAEK
ncbi:hypothetical protein B0H16DRAFT_1476982 [Mycena metata]|uniref:Uncharacterized protein n=1 Tax=Mycena metata TaxID=1033252 RepID=A0AAD7HAU8_9AGAR|nr:hypothetical protein B0H16DRAFT_1476982 [Mycena metata]